MSIKVTNTLADRGLAVGIAIASAIVVRTSSKGLSAEIEQLVAERQQAEFPPPQLKDAVRGLLKSGGFKPSGRNKPASEYLAQAAREGRFPAINNLVDVNNLISLRSGLPISLLDGKAIGQELTLRYGRDGERYIFNSAGQEIDLAGLICACTGATDSPLGNPVKDSLRGKINDATTMVVGIIYSPKNAESVTLLRDYLSDFADWLTREGAASSVETLIV